MLKREEINQIRDEDHKKMAKVKGSAESIAGQRMSAIQKKAEEIEGKIQDLVDKKSELFSAPLTKNEVLDLLKGALREGKKRWFIENILIPHAKNVQIQKDGPLRDIDLKVYAFSPENVWKVAYAVITEKDLEQAVAALPDIGLSSADRDAQIKKIDTEMAALEEQVEKELKKA